MLQLHDEAWIDCQWCKKCHQIDLPGGIAFDMGYLRPNEGSYYHVYHDD